MKTNKAKTIFIVTYGSFQNRYLLQTDIFKCLKEHGCKIVIITPNGNDERFQKDYCQERIIVEHFALDEIEKVQSTFLYQLFLRVRKFTLPGEYDLSTLRYKEKILRQNSQNERFLKKIVMLLPVWISYFLRKSRFLRQIFINVESLLFSKKYHTALFKKYSPCLLILSDLGTVDYSNFIMREARSAGVPIVSVILSWDNLTAKGMGNIKPDYAVAWNENMKHELETYHEIPSNRIYVGGIAHFDGYFRKGYFFNHDEFIDKFGLSEDKKVLLYGTSSPSLFKENLRIIKVIVVAIRNGLFKEPVHLIIRPHPAYIIREREENANEIELMKKLCAENKDVLSLNLPELFARDFAYETTSRDQRLLSSILKYSDVLITQFSTLMLEAAIFDTPIINIGFDSFGEYDMRSHNLGNSYTHLKRLCDIGFARIAETEEQLVKLIDFYLKNHDLDSIQRRMVRDTEGGPNKGQAGEAIAQHIMELLDECGRPHNSALDTMCTANVELSINRQLTSVGPE